MIVTKDIPVSLKRGDNHKLECEATGNPIPDVVWRRNGVIDPRQQVRELDFSNQIVSSEEIWSVMCN